MPTKEGEKGTELVGSRTSAHKREQEGHRASGGSRRCPRRRERRAQSLWEAAPVPPKQNSEGMNSARSWFYAHGGIKL